jgi:hypothetical protein
MKKNENLTNLIYKNTMPKKQGLYDPAMEHDACGIGFIVNIKGNKSHKIIEQGINFTLGFMGVCENFFIFLVDISLHTCISLLI